MANLRQNQRTAIPLLLSGKTLKEGCELAGINESTFHLWRRNEGFAAEYDRQKSELVNTAYSALERGLQKAAEKLCELVGNEDPRVARLAAKDCLELHLRQTEIAEVLDAIESLKARLDKAGI